MLAEIALQTLDLVGQDFLGTARADGACPVYDEPSGECKLLLPVTAAFGSTELTHVPSTHRCRML